MARPHHAAGGAPCCSDASIDAPTQEARVRPLALTARSRTMAMLRCSEDFTRHAVNPSRSKTFSGVCEMYPSAAERVINAQGQYI